jgi:DNA-binding NtrC family response regulator
MSRAQVLVVDDKESVLELMAAILGRAHDVVTARDPVLARDLLAKRPFDVLLTDVRMPRETGFDLLEAARRHPAAPSVVLMTGYANVADAVDAMRRGAFDYVAKPLDAEEIALVVARAVEARRRRAAGEAGVDSIGTRFHDAVAEARDRASREYLASLMRRFHGNVTHAADQAGMTRESLHRLLKRYGVHSEDFKAGQGRAS